MKENNFILQPLSHLQKDPASGEKEAGWTKEPFWMQWQETFPTPLLGIRLLPSGL